MRVAATCTACAALRRQRSLRNTTVRGAFGSVERRSRLLVDDERRRPVRVSAAQHYHVCDEPDAYAAAVGRNVQRLAHAVVSLDYQDKVEGRDHLLDSYFSVLSFGASRFVNDPIASIVRTPLPTAQLASFFVGYVTQVRARWGGRRRAGTRAPRQLCALIDRSGRAPDTARFVAVWVWVAALLLVTQDTETNQLIMMPGGLYSDFHQRGRLRHGQGAQCRAAGRVESALHCDWRCRRVTIGRSAGDPPGRPVACRRRHVVPVWPMRRHRRAQRGRGFPLGQHGRFATSAFRRSFLCHGNVAVGARAARLRRGCGPKRECFALNARLIRNKDANSWRYLQLHHLAAGSLAATRRPGCGCK